MDSEPVCSAVGFSFPVAVVCGRRPWDRASDRKGASPCLRARDQPAATSGRGGACLAWHPQTHVLAAQDARPGPATDVTVLLPRP